MRRMNLSNLTGEQGRDISTLLQGVFCKLIDPFFNGQATNGIDHYGTCEMPRVKVGFREDLVIKGQI